MPTTRNSTSPNKSTPTDPKSPEAIGVRNVFEKLVSGNDGVPVEFELPEWLTKQKSTQYISIKRNIYLIKRRVEDDGIFCSCSSSPGKSSVCGGDCHCGMLFSSCSSSCKCGSECNNKPFQHRPVKKLKLVKTKKCGLGLTADEDIKQGDFVIEYVGEVIDDKTCEERLWKMKHRGDTNFYLCEVNHDMVIDATYKGNKSRFMNHSCEPNTEMQKWSIEGETRIGIFATRNIKRGESLTYDYQFVQFGADQECHCGALGCRQKLGSQYSKLKESLCNAGIEGWRNGVPLAGFMQAFPENGTSFRNCIGQVVRIWSTQDKRYYGGVISDFDCYTSRHTIIYEDGRVEPVDMSKQDWDFL